MLNKEKQYNCPTGWEGTKVEENEEKIISGRGSAGFLAGRKEPEGGRELSGPDGASAPWRGYVSPSFISF